MGAFQSAYNNAWANSRPPPSVDPNINQTTGLPFVAETFIPQPSTPSMQQIALPGQGNVTDFTGGTGNVPAFTAGAGNVPKWTGGYGNIPLWQQGVGNIPTYQRASGSELPDYNEQNFKFDQTVADPSYKFRYEQGQKALERRLAASGNRFSGGGMLELQKYGQDYASTEYEKEYQRQASAFGINQGERQFGYGTRYQKASDTYGRGVEEYGIGRQREADIYGRNQYVHQLSLDREQNQWNRKTQVYGFDVNREGTMWNRQAQIYSFDVNRENAMWNRGVTVYGLNRTAETDRYNRGLTNYNLQYGQQQDFLNRLSGMAGMGPTMAQGMAGAAGQYGQGVGNIASGYGNSMSSFYQNQANMSLAQSQGFMNTLGNLGSAYFMGQGMR